MGDKIEQNALYLSLLANIAIFHDSVHLSHDIFRIGQSNIGKSTF
nr:MAG TPA: Ras family [Caudoviricetes sp.]